MNEGNKMARLITVVTKYIFDPWMIVTPENAPQYFSQEEIDTILTPYFDYVRNLPGIIPEKFKQYTTDTQTTNVREFDTVENAKNALFKMSVYSDEPIVIARNTLVQNKTKELGLHFEITNKIIP